MNQLVATRTRALDTTLLRFRLTSTSFSPTIETLGLDTGYRQTMWHDEPLDFQFHPIMHSYTGGRVGDWIYEPDTPWSEVLYEPGKGYRLGRPCPLHWLEEIREHATSPPCIEAHISFWNGATFDGVEVEKKVGDDGWDSKHESSCWAVVKGTEDASKVVQPVTVEQLVKTYLKAINLANLRARIQLYG